MAKNNLLSEELNYIGESRTPTHLHLCSYSAKDIQTVTGKELEDILPHMRDEAINWIQIHGLENTGIVRDVCNHFHVDFLTVQDILNSRHLTKIEEHDTYNVVLLKQLSPNEENEYTPQQFCIIQGENFVLTFLEKDTDFFNEINTAINNRDYSLIQGTVLFSAIMFVFCNMLVDVAYMLLNPKVKGA